MHLGNRFENKNRRRITSNFIFRLNHSNNIICKIGKMSCDHIIALSQYLLLFILVCADSASCSQVHYYVRPSPNVYCPGDPCLTLAQLATNSVSYLESTLSLSFLPGNHSLDRELSLPHADNFSMTKDIEGNGIVFVECASRLGRFNISEVTSGCANIVVI